MPCGDAVEQGDERIAHIIINGRGAGLHDGIGDAQAYLNVAHRPCTPMLLSIGGDDQGDVAVEAPHRVKNTDELCELLGAGAVEHNDEARRT